MIRYLQRSKPCLKVVGSVLALPQFLTRTSKFLPKVNFGQELKAMIEKFFIRNRREFLTVSN